MEAYVGGQRVTRGRRKVPAGGAGRATRCKLPSSITTAMARSLAVTNPVVTNPVAIEVLPDDSILILDSPELASFSRVVRIAADGVTAEDSTEKAKTLVEESKRADFQLRGHDFVVVGERLYVAGSDGDQAVAFRIDLEHGFALHALAEFFPMRLFGARALIAGAESPLYDAQDRWVPLVEQRRQRFAHESRLLIPRLDGKQPDCVWHRLLPRTPACRRSARCSWRAAPRTIPRSSALVPVDHRTRPCLRRATRLGAGVVERHARGPCHRTRGSCSSSAPPAATSNSV